MEDEKMKSLIIDYLEGNLTGELKEFVSNHIQKTDKWKIEFEQLKELTVIIDEDVELSPPSQMKSEFESLLEKEISNPSIEVVPKTAKTIYWNSPKIWMQIAASISILVIGLFAGYKITNNQNQEEIAALRQEMELTKTLVLASLENQSASSRLNAVNVSNRLSTMDIEITNALIGALNSDANANVRLAALDALSKFAEEEYVRSALVSSLEHQDKPIVQIALINFLVELKESRVKEVLKRITENENIETTVRDEASYGLYRL